MVKCSNCGANIELKDEQREFCFCEYCGSKILLDDYRITNHIVDEARIKEAEAYQMIRNRELDMEERAIVEKKRKKMVKYIVALILMMIAFILFIVSLFCPPSEAFGYRFFVFVFFAIALAVAIETFSDKS